jgi:methanogenic corrinoid protein MtbC1
MEQEMNEQDKHALLINNLLELEEVSALAQVKERLENGDDPLAILEDAREGMQQVGLRYEEGKYYVAGLMMAGEIYREVMELVEPILVQRLSGNESGHILLGTVQGDIHDIGKNIFSTMLRCHGFTVTDLGIDIPPARFIEEASKLRPDIIGLYGLLTTSYEVMKSTVQLVKQSSDPQLASTPIILGGGTLNPMVCAFVGADYWAIDAMAGIELCKQMMAKRKESN